MYDSFFEDAELNIAQTFHEANWSERVGIVELFSDERLRNLGLRLIHQEHPEILDQQVQNNLDTIVSDRLAGDKTTGVPWRTLRQALAEVDKMLPSTVGSDVDHLNSISSFLKTKL